MFYGFGLAIVLCMSDGKDRLNLARLLAFRYTHYFMGEWRRIGLSDAELVVFEKSLLAEPTQGSVMAGTGGLRKMRFAASGKGKSGGVRIGYAFYPEHRVILVVTVYAKNDQTDLAPAQRMDVRKALDRFAA
ncbi:MAG: type II toxin-antitoxin system RelE/ParE family toxin, partial [Phycisphaerae bacterium]